MGQRLVLVVKDGNGEFLAASYYHWSAYTLSYLDIMKEIGDYFARNPRPAKDAARAERIEYAIRALEHNSTAGFFPTEAALTRGVPEELLQKRGDRHDGMITVREALMDEWCKWAESVVDIGLTDEYFDLSPLLWDESESEEEISPDDGGENEEHLLEPPHSIYEIPFTQVHEMISFIEKVETSGGWRFYDPIQGLVFSTMA